MSALVDMYTTCRRIQKAQKLFNMGSLEECMDIYQRVFDNGFSLNFVVVTSLVYMYAKCRRI